MHTPDNISAPAAAAFLAVVAANPGDVRSGTDQLIDLAAVLAGEPAPSRPRTAATRSTRRHRNAPMSLTVALSNVMGYVSAAPASPVERALADLRAAVLDWSPEGNTPLAAHSAPPSSAHSS